jgi:hypothetical protein
MASGSRASTPQDGIPSRYRNIRYKSDLYVEDTPTESYTRDVRDYKVVADEHEAIVIDNGTPLLPQRNLEAKTLYPQEHPTSAQDLHHIQNPTSMNQTSPPASRPGNP